MGHRAGRVRRPEGPYRQGGPGSLTEKPAACWGEGGGRRGPTRPPSVTPVPRRRRGRRRQSGRTARQGREGCRLVPRPWPAPSGAKGSPAPGGDVDPGAVQDAGAKPPRRGGTRSAAAMPPSRTQLPGDEHEEGPAARARFSRSEGSETTAVLSAADREAGLIPVARRPLGKTGPARLVAENDLVDVGEAEPVLGRSPGRPVAGGQAEELAQPSRTVPCHRHWPSASRQALGRERALPPRPHGRAADGDAHVVPPAGTATGVAAPHRAALPDGSLPVRAGRQPGGGVGWGRHVHEPACAEGGGHAALGCAPVRIPGGRPDRRVDGGQPLPRRRERTVALGGGPTRPLGSPPGGPLRRPGKPPTERSHRSPFDPDSIH